MKKDVKQAMLKNIDKKKEIERLSNKSLTIFTVVLILEVLLIFISSGLTATKFQASIASSVVVNSFSTDVPSSKITLT